MVPLVCRDARAVRRRRRRRSRSSPATARPQVRRVTKARGDVPVRAVARRRARRGDQVVERGGASVFLDALAAEELADQMLDDRTSHGDHVHFDFVRRRRGRRDADDDAALRAGASDLGREPHLGARAVARARSSSVPRSSSRTSARTIERPVPAAGASVDARRRRRRSASTTSPSRRASSTCDVRAAVLERVAEQLREDERERGRAVAGERHRLEPRLDLACPAPTPWTSIARRRPSRSARSTSSSRRSVSTSCTAAIARIRLTESSSALRGSTPPGGARLQAQQRRDGLQVVLDAVVDLLGEHAAHHRAAVLERDGRVLRDRRQQLAVVRR